MAAFDSPPGACTIQHTAGGEVKTQTTEAEGWWYVEFEGRGDHVLTVNP